MEDNSLQLHEFFIEGGNAERSHALLHITEPSTPEEKQKGYFFAVCEIIGSTTEYIAELEQTIDVIEKGYYEDIEHSNAEALEAILDQVNKQSANIIRRNIELHWMVGIIADNDIIFSFYGRPTIMLFYKNKEGFYNHLDLVAQNPVERSANTAVFSQIIRGKISPNDYLAVTTPHVREFYDQDRLQRIVTTRSAEESCRHLEKSFNESKRELSFAGVIVTVGRSIERRPAPAPRIPQISRGSSESLDRLFSTEKNTARTLASSFGKSVQSGLERLTKRDKKTSAPVSSVFANDTEDDEEDDFLKPVSPLARRSQRFEKLETKDYILQAFRLVIAGVITLGKWLLKLGIILLTAIGGIFRFFGTLFIALINSKRRGIILANWKRALVTFRDHVYHLPFLTKLFLILTVLLTIGVTGTVIYFNRQHTIAAQAKEFRTTAQAIEKKRDSADADLTYQNETSARKHLEDARVLFDKLPCKETKIPTEQETCKKLQGYLDGLAVQLRRMTSTQIELITSWEQSNIALTGLVKVGNLLMTNSPDSPVILIYNMLSKENSSASAPSSTVGFRISATTPGKDYAVFLTPSNELYSVDNKGALKKQTFSLSKPDTTLTGMLMYGNRLYSLDTPNLQIYRHDRIAAGFSRGTDWIKNGAENIRDAVSFAIDGDLWALKKNGTIAKYSAGETQAFAIQNLDPALTSGQALSTYDGYSYIYILDSTEGRIVILRKDGTLKVQLTAPELKDAASFVVEEGNKTGYFLSGNKVYKVKLEI